MALAIVVIVAGVLGAQVPTQGHAVSRPSQAQLALRFLRAVLRAEYAAAYERLAPEIRRSVSLAQFGTEARPLWRAGQRYNSEIELYKLGVRIDESGDSRLFYSFSFTTDSSRRPPSALLEVTFRDTASASVLGFALREIKKVKRAAHVPAVRRTKAMKPAQAVKK